MLIIIKDGGPATAHMPLHGMIREVPMKESLHDIRVRKEYEAIRGFYAHVLVFIPVILLLVVIDVVSGTGMWVHWVGLGWGLGLALHAYAAFVQTPRQMAKWEREQIDIVGRSGSTPAQEAPAREA